MSIPKPPAQRISRKRVQMIHKVALVAAVLLTVYDAYVSYTGFQMLALPQHAPLVLAALIFVIQLSSGVIQQLGMNPFKGVGGSEGMDFVWRWVLVSVYVIDVGSNAIAFGVGSHANGSALRSRPLDALAMSTLLVLLSLLLTFGDEILLRLVDRIQIGSRANDASAIKTDIEVAAYRRYLTGYRERAIEYADKAGQGASVDFDWMQERRGDNAA